MSLPASVIIEVAGMHESGGLDGSVFNGIYELPFVYDVSEPFRNVLYYLSEFHDPIYWKYSFFARMSPRNCDFSIVTWQQWFRTGNVSTKNFVKGLILTNDLDYEGTATIISTAMSLPVINPDPTNTKIGVLINLNQLSWEVDE